MEPRFNVIFLEEAIEFLEGLDEKAREKVFYNYGNSISMIKTKADGRKNKEIHP